MDAVVLPAWPGGPGRPPEDRRALAWAFLAKAVFDVPTTRALIERLRIDGTLRRLCGWTRAGAVPSEATFSRAFAAFAASGLPERLHAGLVAKTLRHRLVGHISRDATTIPAREAGGAQAAEALTRPSAQGGGAAAAPPPGAPAGDDVDGDAGGPAAGVRRRHEAQCEWVQGDLDRLQAPPRCGGRRGAGELHPDPGVAARQPDGAAARAPDGRAGDQLA